MKVDQALFDAVRRLAVRAGEAIMQVYAGEFAVTKKDDLTPLTEADLAAHCLIEAGLIALCPDLPVLSEEGADVPFATRQGWERYWLVDPLDGTREFVKRNGEFSVNIALVDGHEVVLGVVHAPALGVTYAAWRGAGAWKWSGDEDAPARIAVARPASSPLRVALSRSHGSKRMQAYLDALQAVHGEAECVYLGSALKSCLVAEGAADVYPRLGLTSEWDTAAAQCVVEEAGGHMTDTTGERMRYNGKDSLLNPEFLVFADRGVDWAGFVPSLENN
ncbi:MAG: 3'(2'),5'-bisphosphate nucleotidase CysQ [Halothiobacillaceae bacterium]